MPKPSNLKKGQVARHNGELWRIVNITHITPGNKRAIFQIQMKHLTRGQTVTNRFSAADEVEVLHFEPRPMQYLYKEGENHCFMDMETYDQIMVPHEMIEDAAPYMALNSEVKVNFVDGRPVSVDLPAAVVLEVKQTDPGIKGDTVSNVFKPATVETELEIKVPLHINMGDLVKVDTRTGEFLERVSSR